MIRSIVDAGPLVGCLSANDQWHHWSVEALSAADSLLTTEAVLAEAAYHLRKSREAVSRLLSWVADDVLVVVPVVREHAGALDALLGKYAVMDLCDATVVRLSEMFPDSRVITTDRRHFQIYRRNGRQRLPAIFPD